MGRLLAVVLVVLAARPWRARPRRMTLGDHRSPSGMPRPARGLVVVVAAAGGLVAGGPVLAAVAGAAATASGPVVDRVRAQRARRAVAAAVPDLVDLFLVAASAGQPVAAALAAVAERAPPAVRAVVVAARDRFTRGLPLDESLAGLGEDLAPEGVPLADALRQAASAGVPLVPLLDGVAAAARDARRRRAQEVARRLPVTMLFPLVACVLPAAIALAVVPVLLVSLGSLSP